LHNRFHLKGSFWLELALVGVLLTGSVLAMNDVVEDDEFAETASIVSESENSTNTYDGDLKDRQPMVPSIVPARWVLTHFAIGDSSTITCA